MLTRRDRRVSSRVSISMYRSAICSIRVGSLFSISAFFDCFGCGSDLECESSHRLRCSNSTSLLQNQRMCVVVARHRSRRRFLIGPSESDQSLLPGFLLYQARSPKIRRQQSAQSNGVRLQASQLKAHRFNSKDLAMIVPVRAVDTIPGLPLAGVVYPDTTNERRTIRPVQLGSSIRFPC